MMWIVGIIILVVAVGGWLFYRHQCVLRDRAEMMREAIRNKDFMFRLPNQGMFFGERALQETLNDFSGNVNRLMARNEVESWQRLTRVLTHEIMNAATPIRSISEAYLQSDAIKGTQYEEGIRAIHETSVGLTTFVDSYRKMTQLQKPQPADVCLLQTVNTVKALCPDVDWRIDIDAAQTMVVDEGLLRQVLINIVKNAVEAGAHTIDVRWQDGLLVSNDGAIIPPTVCDEIFVPFFTTKTTGCGIGLSLSRQILMVQGYDLALADRPVAGHHVTFIIS